MFLETVVPALGAIVSMLMYGAPLSAVLKASANKTLGVSFIRSLAVLDIFQIFLRRCKMEIIDTYLGSERHPILHNSS